jgi:hypothetical protein
MSISIRVAAWTAAALACLPVAASAQQEVNSPQALRAEIDRLRQEFETVRQQYGTKLEDLERRLTAIEGRAPGAAEQPPPGAPGTPPVTPPGQPTEAAVPAGAAGAGGPAGALPVYGNASLLSKIFNPDMAVIGNFLGAAGTNNVAPLPALEMREAETSFQAVVDPYARADFFLSFGADGAEIEEGFITFPTIPGDLSVKVGKLRSQFGKVNTMHSHILPWTDRPLVTDNLVGGEEGISDAGISVSRLFANPWIFLEATGEVYNGTNAVFTSSKRSDLTYVGHLRAYHDLSEATNLDFGTSIAYGKNETGGDASTRLIGVDATFRYRPLTRALYKRFIARTELIWSRRENFDVPVSSFGTYVGADYQFARRWFAGARVDYSARAFDSSLKDKGASVLVTYWPSEFSQVRGQYRQIRYADADTAHEFLFQFLFSIGAHGAHAF